MYESIRTRNKNISVRLRENGIAVINDEELFVLITQMPESATDEFVVALKSEFHWQFNKDFGVANASIAVEIWGHVFADKFADAVKAITPLKFVDGLAEKISTRCEIINIGSKDHDTNRVIWDWLAPFKPVIAAILLKQK
jgi:hypothetical protein